MFVINECRAQNSQAQTKTNDNYTVQYLIVFNNKNEILMMKNGLGWHTPAIRSDKPQAIREAMDSLSHTLGLRISNIKLSGVYTHKFRGVPDHPEVSFRTYYTALYQAGSINQLPGKGVEYYWIQTDKALPLLHFEFMKQQIRPILRDREKVWGGTFLITWEKNQFKNSEIIENVYQLGGS
ncbi:hypothetical protein [Mucilaginibacter defluvii]